MENRVDWLTNLEAGKRVVAMLIVGIMAVFGMWMRSEYNRGVEMKRHEAAEAQYKEVLIKRTDAFNDINRQLLIDCNTKVEDVLREQLQRSESTLNKTNKIVEKNGSLIKQIQTKK